MKIELCVWIPGGCKGGTKPIDGAVMLGKEKYSKIRHVVTGNGIYAALASF